MEERISWGGQVQVYVGKRRRQFLNEKGYKSLVSAAIIGVIIALVMGRETFTAFGDTRSGMFALTCGCIWIGVFNSIQIVCRERAIVKREYRTGLSISAYITAHMVFECVQCFAEALIVTALLFVLRQCPERGVFLPVFAEVLITFFLITFAADALGLVVSCIAKTETGAMTVMPFVLIIQMVVSGVIFQLYGAAASFLGALTISKWGVNALCTIANAGDMLGYYASSSGADYSFTPWHLMTQWFVMVFYILLYAMICIAALSFVDKDQR